MKIKYILLLLAVFAVTAFSSCTKELDLDEDTLLQIEKQEKLAELDDLFYLAFDDPEKAEEDFNVYVSEELLRNGQNFLLDNDILLSKNFTDLAIQLNKNIKEGYSLIEGKSLYELTCLRFKTDVNNRTLLGQIPQLLKSGEKLEKFENERQSADKLFKAKIAELKAKTVIDQSLIGKNWYFSKFTFQQVGTSRFYYHNILFDFSFNADKSMNINSFFYMPYIPSDALLAGSVEGAYNGEIINEPLTYEIYDNKIFFHFHLQNNRDIVYQTGFRERHWFYEYEYNLVNNQLVLSKPKIGFYMYPELKLLQHNDAGFQAVYPEDMQQFSLSIK